MIRLACAVVVGVVASGLVLSACTSSGSKDAGGGTTSGNAATNAARVANVTVTSASGCVSDQQTLAAGAITFKITNKDAAAVSEVELLAGERIVGEKENLPPGFSGDFTVKADAGAYQLYCPGATPERRPITVTGKTQGVADATVATLLDQASAGYATYVNTQIAALVTEVAAFDKTLHGTNLAAAQTAYMKARIYYERIEPVAESFVIGKDSIDADIDVRIADTTFAQWRGFHRIEYGLFKQKSLQGMGAFGDKLVADVARLKSLTTGLTYKPTELANGAQGLLDEVAAHKITGEEEAYSGIDMLDFAANVEGSQQAFAQLEPALTKIDPVLAKTIATRFAALDTLVAKYKTTANPSGYTLFPQLTTTDKRGFIAAIKAVQEPLSSVASKIANA